jgi:tungstate transport system substrate-binding protein
MHSRTRQIAAALLAALLLVVTACGDDDDAGSASSPVILATTTSTQDSGLLDLLVPAFEKATGRQVKTVAVGSGQAIEMGERGEADVVLAHSPAAEEELMATGKASSRRVVMHNDFVLVGPAGDPAKVRGLSATRAMERIARARAAFISRGDDSGTHKFELKLWEQAEVKPRGSWYLQSGQGMGATLQIARDKRAYTLSDRGTFLATDNGGDLKVLVDGGSALLNPYHVMDIDAKAGLRVNSAGGKAFADWIVSPAAQAIIRTFGKEKFGQPLFVPDAGKTDAEVAEAA